VAKKSFCRVQLRPFDLDEMTRVPFLSNGREAEGKYGASHSDI